MNLHDTRPVPNVNDEADDVLGRLRDRANEIVDDVRPPATSRDLHQSWIDLRDQATMVDTVIPKAEQAVAIIRDDTIRDEGRTRLAREALADAHTALDGTIATLQVHVQVFKAQLATTALGTVNPRRSAEAKADARDILSVASTTTDLVSAATTLADSPDDDLVALAGSDWMQRFLTARGVTADTMQPIRDRAINRNIQHHNDPNVREAAKIYTNTGKLDSLATVRKQLVKQTIRFAEANINPNTAATTR